MKKIYQATILLTLTFLLSACVDNKNISKPTVKKEVPKEKKAIKKIKKVDLKQIQLHKTCNKYRSYLNHSKKYILDEFNNAYFITKDIVGAKAQLFLIENNSPTPFATNINKALKTYNKYYDIAKKSTCNLSKYQISPINQIKKTILDLNKK